MVKIEFYPADITYKLREDGVLILLYGKTAEGRQICVQYPRFTPYFYAYDASRAPELLANHLKNIKLDTDEHPAGVTTTEILDKKHLGKKFRLVKAYTKYPGDIVQIKKQLLTNYKNITFFESDIPIARRFLLDKNITPLLLTEAEGEFINQHSRVSVFSATELQPSSAEQIPDLKTLAIDIETYSPMGIDPDPDKNPIIMISLYSENFKKVIISKKFPSALDYLEFVDNEQELIKRFSEILAEYKPDIIVGYYSDSFDLPFLQKRAEKNNLRLDIGLDYTSINVRTRIRTRSTITGILHLDLSQFIKKALAGNLETHTYSLNAVAKELLGKQKEFVKIENLAEIFDNHPEELEYYAKYTLADSELAFLLYQKLLPTFFELARLTSLPLDELSRMSFSELAENYIIRRATEMGELIPSRPSKAEAERRKIETFQGGFVYQPNPGIYKDLVVFDYRSLYPSIITSHNISPDSLNCSCCEGKSPVPDESYWFCKNKKGFISILVEELVSRRIRIKEIIRSGEKSEALDAREYVLKTTANSIYGYLGFYLARWYSMECVKSITSYGRYYINKLIEKVSGEGFEIIYSDTDSVFLALNGKSLESAKGFVELYNLGLPEQIDLEFHGYYPKAIFVGVKSGNVGAKKRYALLTQNNKVIIRGFETVRSNISPIAKETQEEILKIILKENNPEKALAYLKATIEKIRERKIPLRKMIIYTRLQKRIDQYETIGPHVAVAKLLLEKGQDIKPGSLIKYVICGTGERVRDKARPPTDCTKDDYDIDYYINHQVIPSVEKIFEMFGYFAETFTSDIDQAKLETFFTQKDKESNQK